MNSVIENLRKSVNHLGVRVGSVQYAATDTRPNLSAKFSLIQAKINQPCMKDLLEANRLLHEAKVHGCASQKDAASFMTWMKFCGPEQTSDQRKHG